MPNRTFIVRQTEEFRVRADDADDAVDQVANDPEASTPTVEWLSCTERSAEEV